MPNLLYRNCGDITCRRSAPNDPSFREMFHFVAQNRPTPLFLSWAVLALSCLLHVLGRYQYGPSNYPVQIDRAGFGLNPLLAEGLFSPPGFQRTEIIPHFEFELVRGLKRVLGLQGWSIVLVF